MKNQSNATQFFYQNKKLITVTRERISTPYCAMPTCPWPRFKPAKRLAQDVYIQKRTKRAERKLQDLDYLHEPSTIDLAKKKGVTEEQYGSARYKNRKAVYRNERSAK